VQRHSRMPIELNLRPQHISGSNSNSSSSSNQNRHKLPYGAGWFMRSPLTQVCFRKSCFSIFHPALAFRFSPEFGLLQMSAQPTQVLLRAADGEGLGLGEQVIPDLAARSRSTLTQDGRQKDAYGLLAVHCMQNRKDNSQLQSVSNSQRCHHKGSTTAKQQSSHSVLLLPPAIAGPTLF